MLRVAESAHFQKSPKLREFLLYVCERTLQNRQHEVREHQIGNQVFGRREHYSPAEDNIVRVEARQLRKRLDEYFAIEGKDEPIVIVIPKGTYIPSFAPRQMPEPVNGAAITPVPAVAPSRGVARLTVRYAIPVILLLGCIWLWKQNLDLRAVADARANQKLAHPWAELFDSNHQTYVVVADSARVLVQDILGRPVSLTEYLSRKHPSQNPSPKADIEGIVEMLSSRRYTSLADVILVARILQLSSNYWPRTFIRSARDVEIRDFKTHNIILIGSARSTPWDELFDQVLNFDFQFDVKTKRAYFLNRSPKPGERPAYYAGVNNGIAETYADVALVPNLNHTGNVLILAGANMEGTEAAGEFAANPERCGKLFGELGLLKDGRLQYFEVLLKSRTVAGMARESDVVAWRILPDAAGRQ